MEFSEVRFTELDADGNGSVTKQEWNTKKKAMREKQAKSGYGY